MRTYDKRIGFLVSYQTLIPHGGIGQFTKGFCELMDQYNIKVDIITDKKPDMNDPFIKSLNTRIIYPDDSLSYSKHSSAFMYVDTFNYARMENFTHSIVKALSSNLYDTFVCNTYETVQVASTMGLDDCIQIIAYTHLESQIFEKTKNPFYDTTNSMMRLQLNADNLYIGTQSKFNKFELDERVTSDKVYHLPIPLSEKGLLTEYNNEREGILFVGRWEEGKNPELFLELIEQTKLPAKVMTSENGAKKFTERLKKIGVPFDVRVGIIGKEKVDFMNSARVAFNPSIVESYGMAFYEQIITMPTFALENQRWTSNFDSKYFRTTNKKTMAEDIKAAYEEFPDSKSWYEYGQHSHFDIIESKVFHKWNECFNDFQPKQSSSDASKFAQTLVQIDTVKSGEFILKLSRASARKINPKLAAIVDYSCESFNPCIDDIRSALTNKYRYRVIYTDDDTYLTTNPSFEPTEEVTGAALFSFV